MLLLTFVTLVAVFLIFRALTLWVEKQPPHQWRYEEFRDVARPDEKCYVRVCTICGKRQLLDVDGWCERVGGKT